MFAWFREYRKSREIQQLNRDAPVIIEYSRQCLRPDTMRQAALMTRQHLERVKNVYGGDPLGAKRALVEYRIMHAEGRRKRDDAAITAFTLVQLYIRAEIQGEPCRRAQTSIDDFVAEWAHAEEN